MRSFAAVLAVGLAALVAVGLTERSSLVYSLGVKPALVATTLSSGDRVCQGPVRAPSGADFDRVGFLLTTSGRPGPAVRVEVLESATSRRLGSGHLEAGYADHNPARPREHVVPVGRVQSDEPLDLCLIDEGPGPVGVVGQAGVASPHTSATVDGEALPTDLTLNLRAGERPVLALLPDIADRAARFRAGWVTPLAYLVLAAAILVGAPLLLARGIARLPAGEHEKP